MTEQQRIKKLNKADQLSMEVLQVGGVFAFFFVALTFLLI